MLKKDLIGIIAEKTNITKKNTETVINEFITTVTDALVTGDDVKLTGFICFEVKDVAERTGRNPKTSETILIPAHKKVAVKVGKALKDAVNE